MTEKQMTKAQAAVIEKIASPPAAHRALCERVHEIILETVPGLRPKLWYGMPGYTRGGPVLVCFRVDDGQMVVGLTEHANIAVGGGARQARRFGVVPQRAR